jgi:hypothetical protein
VALSFYEGNAKPHCKTKYAYTDCCDSRDYITGELQKTTGNKYIASQAKQQEKHRERNDFRGEA